MKAAFTTWNDRISPVFDVAGQALLVESDQNQVVRQETFALPVDSVMEKLAFLENQNVDLLVCGAISRSLQCAVEAQGIKVYPFCLGEINQLVNAWMGERLDQETFAMPGCGRGRGRKGRGNGCRCSDFPRGRFNQKNRRQ
ncbi:NifB/NifX family molybdenum-iron cluster-binding protein [Vibrio sp. JC009]|uniref:NifB/NifX family molybdenum-iron cluster-binding protein n=1 Tax=Vibrio sp. JC009 TaxID=2912314 RepID=UPI0023AF6EFE|nr:NifB/NifX family molybdenum-iron cluster-binding protein [Vibrio sp. JC009]WED23816.1 NifB/NifX family molybdenum-iron cluster-binding protein [Vibrio sp. JC009]